MQKTVAKTSAKEVFSYFFFPRSFTVSGLMFKVLIHFECIFVSGVRLRNLRNIRTKCMNHVWLLMGTSQLKNRHFGGQLEKFEYDWVSDDVKRLL